MHSKDLLDWLSKYSLLSVAKNHSAYFKNVLKSSLKTASNESVLVISDFGLPKRRVAPLMSGAYYLAAKKLGLEVDVVMQSVKSVGESADPAVISLLRKKDMPGIVVFNLSNKLGRLGSLGKSYRRYVRDKKHRFVSTLGTSSMVTNDFYSVTRALDIDYFKLRKECVKLKRALDWGRELIVKTNTGTCLRMDITGCRSVSNDGRYESRGNGGNMPSGEVYIPPKIDTAEGKVVIDCSSKTLNGTQLIKRPIILTVKKGFVVNIEGGYEAKMLTRSVAFAEKSAKNPASVRKIGELGIGLNPKAGIIGTVIVDEKSLGTAHVALGSNYWFGGDVFTIVHLDQVFKNPKIFIDGKEYRLPKRSGLL